MPSKLPKRWAHRNATGVSFVFGVASVIAPGCFTHQCDPTTASFNGGHMVDDNTYETNAFDEPWIGYPPNVTLNVDFSSVTGVPRRISDIHSWLGVSPLPFDANCAAMESCPVPGAGSLVETSDWSTTGFRAINTTCANYYARFVVYFEPLGGADAGAD